MVTAGSDWLKRLQLQHKVGSDACLRLNFDEELQQGTLDRYFQVAAGRRNLNSCLQIVRACT